MTDAIANPEDGGPPPAAAEKNAPSHIPHSVRRGTDGQSYWTPIGVGFAHKAGSGVNLSLDCLPRDGRIVVRERKRGAPESEQSPEGTGVPAAAAAAEEAVAKSTSPTHLVYTVRKGRDDRSFWTSVGTAFAHGDGKGWNLRIDSLPLDGGLVVLERQRRAPGEDARAEAPAS